MRVLGTGGIRYAYTSTIMIVHGVSVAVECRPVLCKSLSVYYIQSHTSE